MHTFPLLATLWPSLSAKTLAAAFGYHLGRSWTSGRLDTGNTSPRYISNVQQRWTSALAMTTPSLVLRDSPSALTWLRLSLCESVLAKPWLSLRDEPFAHVRPSAPLSFWNTGTLDHIWTWLQHRPSVEDVANAPHWPALTVQPTRRRRLHCHSLWENPCLRV
jgi:hypothetical protein